MKLKIYRLHNKITDHKKHEEHQYLDLIRKILIEGDDRTDRTNVGTKNIFGAQLRFDLRQSFPLLTTKRVGKR